MKIIATNRRARHDYEIETTFQAGIALEGHEVKSIRAGHISLKGSFVHLRNGEAYLVNAHIRRYSQATHLVDHDPLRSRKLLLHAKELVEITEAKQAKGMSIIPLAVGLQRSLIKVEIGLGRGKKHYDKRELARKKAMERDAAIERRRPAST